MCSVYQYFSKTQNKSTVPLLSKGTRILFKSDLVSAFNHNKFYFTRFESWIGSMIFLYRKAELFSFRQQKTGNKNKQKNVSSCSSYFYHVNGHDKSAEKLAHLLNQFSNRVFRQTSFSPDEKIQHYTLPQLSLKKKIKTDCSTWMMKLSRWTY